MASMIVMNVDDCITNLKALYGFNNSLMDEDMKLFFESDNSYQASQASSSVTPSWLNSDINSIGNSNTIDDENYPSIECLEEPSNA